MFKMPIQINGKTRSLLMIDINEEKEDVLKKVFLDPKVVKNIENKKIIKTIYVKSKIVNLVVE